MDIYDRLELYEIQIKRCEYRIRRDDFNSIIHLTGEIINALEISDRFDIHKLRLSRRLAQVSRFNGTSETDLSTLRAFDYHKRTVLDIIKRVRKQILDIELEL